ncbi:Phosphoinositide phospholipase C 2 [Glycine max]|nr:Phosphoinositide phospholipase C 2 [Glycine max]
MGYNIATYNKYKSLLFFIRNCKFTKLLTPVTELLPPQDLMEAYSKFTGGGSYMSAKQLHRFLEEHQGAKDHTLTDLEKVVEKVLQVRKTCQEIINVDQNREQQITHDELFHFLLHDDFNGPLIAKVHHDMGAPLSHYFIYTGHNSYLTGNQLSSDCSEEPIIKALKRGVRVIELDLWPTFNKDDIKGHGKSLWLMQGMFRANGGCGYVKKPQILMQKHQCGNEFDPTWILTVKKTLKVKVYTGHGWSLDFSLSSTHFDNCSPPDFYTEFKVTEPVSPQDLEEAFSKFTGGGSHMSADELHRFLVEHQGEEDYTLLDSEKVVEKVLKERKRCQESVKVDQNREHEITLDELFRFLLHDDSNGPLKAEVHHDMGAPLSHYFIYTGHNSYLTGNQLSSDCSEEPIIKALKRGVRVIELDLWPTYNKHDIKEYGFVASEYPVIITIEDHLTTDLRAKFAEMATQIFGEMLFYPGTDCSCLTEFPSPESLKNRVIISTKPPKERFKSNRIKDNPMLNESDSSEEETWGNESPDSNKNEVETEDTNGSDRDEGNVSACECDHKPYQECSPDYKHIITIHNTKLKGCMKDKLKTDGEVRRLSWSEKTLEKASESHGTDILRFTQKNIIRVYPKGTRVTSSNYRPHIGWMYGAQMVAFNMQGHGKSLWYMQGMFRANGGCGYVKKPAFLIEKGPHNEVFDPKRALPVKKTLKVRYYLKRKSIDLVCIVGVPADKANKKTKVIQDNWFPVWDEEFEFPLTVPELALLRIEVREYDKHEKDDFGGQTCLPISELRSGFRAVPLFDQKGEQLKSVKLLMRQQVMTSKQTYSVCFCWRRRFKLALAEAPSEIKTLFNEYSENELMTPSHLKRFLVDVQRQEKATEEDAQAIIDSFRHFHRRGAGLNLETFFKYLFSDDNPPLLPSHGVHHDMTLPLSHYFIYTGHNSYLTGNQLSSDCSDVPIINALKKGVRVIELDIWPNASKDSIDVLHGRTLTTPVELIRCLRSIKDHAFVASEYPVVITLEDHLTPDLQAKVAEMVTQTFGDILFTPNSESVKEFPSPESLKKRIIISTKPPKEYLEAKEKEKGDDSQHEKEKGDDSEHGKASGEDEAWGKEVPSLKGGTIEDYKDNNVDEDLNDEEEFDESDKSHHNEAPEYRHLIAIHAGKPKGGLVECLKVDPEKVRRLSLSEQQLEKAAINYGQQIVRFTQRNILRVYPKGTRIDSSNYNPLIGWMHGAQMVAFNMQGYGRSLWLMHGMFRANGGCGYVKKPNFLLETGPDDEVFNPKAKLPVTVYMGEGWYYDFKHTHFDQYSPPDFYTRVGIAGVPNDTIMKRTKAIEDNWLPTWNEAFEFPLTVPELALLRVEVHEYDMSEKDDFGGQTCLPIWELRSGIRAIPLHSQKGDKYNTVKLLMRFEFINN